MSVQDAKRLYDAIIADEQLQDEFEDLESVDKVIEKELEIAESQGIDVNRSDIEALREELAEQVKQLDEEKLENVVGGISHHKAHAAVLNE